MKIAIISEIHSRYVTLESVINTKKQLATQNSTLRRRKYG